jgi:hypothetical protein
MKWLTLVLQLLSLKRSFADSASLAERAGELAARGRLFAVSFLMLALCALFLFSGILLALVELGLQIDRGEIAYSGLMISSTILLAFSFVFGLVSFLLGRSGASAPKPPPPDPRAERIKILLEELVVSFLTKLNSKV